MSKLILRQSTQAKLLWTLAIKSMTLHGNGMTGRAYLLWYLEHEVQKMIMEMAPKGSRIRTAPFSKACDILFQTHHHSWKIRATGKKKVDLLRKIEGRIYGHAWITTVSQPASDLKGGNLSWNQLQNWRTTVSGCNTNSIHGEGKLDNTSQPKRSKKPRIKHASFILLTSQTSYEQAFETISLGSKAQVAKSAHWPVYAST